MIRQIKCGRNVFTIEPGDAIFFNGSVYGYIPKSNSLLPMRGFIRASRVSLSKKEALRVIDQYKPRHRIGNTGVTYYIFS